jgi:hypothetical protein
LGACWGGCRIADRFVVDDIGKDFEYAGGNINSFVSPGNSFIFEADVMDERNLCSIDRSGDRFLSKVFGPSSDKSASI